MSKPRDVFAEWQARLKAYKDKEARGEKLTKEEEEDRYFIQYKLEDYASDMENY